MRKKLGINIDNVIRNYIERFERVYIHTYIDNPSQIETEDQVVDDGMGGTKEIPVNIKELSQEEEQEKERDINQQIQQKIKKPIDSNDLLNHFKFEAGKNYLDQEVTERERMHEFMYDLKPFNIFGQAEPYNKAIDSFHRIQQMGEGEDAFDVILLSTLKSQAITATYFFFSNYGCRPKHVSFVKEDIDKWDFCDAVIDASPETLQTKPEGCLSVKINAEYNKWDMADYSFNSLHEVMENEAFKEHIINFFKNDTE